MPDSASSPGYFSDEPYQDASKPGGAAAAAPRRGLMGHVRIVAILSLIEGGLESLLGIFLFFIGLTLGFGLRSEFIRAFEKGGDPNGGAFVNFMTIFYCGIGGLMLIVGGL